MSILLSTLIVSEKLNLIWSLTGSYPLALLSSSIERGLKLLKSLEPLDPLETFDI